MSRAASPWRDPRAALDLLNRLRAAFGEAPIAQLDEEPGHAQELRAAYPLLAMLVPKAEADASSELLDELRHNWNKAVRRRGWRHLPALAAPPPSAENNASAVRAFLALLGVEWEPADCPAASLADAAALSALLSERLEGLRTPPLPTPAQYADELGAVIKTWNELADVHEGLPKID